MTAHTPVLFGINRLGLGAREADHLTVDSKQNRSVRRQRELQNNSPIKLVTLRSVTCNGSLVFTHILEEPRSDEVKVLVSA